MLVMAKCMADAWDSTRCVQYIAGQVYEIETQSDVAFLTVSRSGTTRTEKDGMLTTVKPQRAPRRVFEFDRAAPLGAVGDGRPSDYTCDECGQKFGSLNALGTHVHKEHPVETFKDGTEDDAAIGSTEYRCKQCDPVKVFLTRGELMSHKVTAHDMFKRALTKPVEAEPISA